MKRNTFMKRLAVTALAATMTLGTVPATAVSTFAATVTSNSKTQAYKNDVQNAAQAVEDSKISTDISLDDTAAVKDKDGNVTTAAKEGLKTKLGKALNLPSDVVVTISKTATTKASWNQDDGIVYGTVTATVSISDSTKDSQNETYTIVMKALDLTDEDKAQIVNDYLAYALNKKFDFSVVGEVNSATLIKAAQQVYTQSYADSKNITKAADVFTAVPTLDWTKVTASDVNDSAKSDKTKRGTVTGKLTFKIGDVSSTVDVNGTREAASTQIQGELNNIIRRMATDTHTIHTITWDGTTHGTDVSYYFANDITADELKEYIVAEFQKNGKDVTVTDVAIPEARSYKATHGHDIKVEGDIETSDPNSKGTISWGDPKAAFLFSTNYDYRPENYGKTGTVTVTDNTTGEKASARFFIGVTQSDDEKLDEAAAKATELSKDGNHPLLAHERMAHGDATKTTKTQAPTKAEVIAWANDIADQAANSFVDANGKNETVNAATHPTNPNAKGANFELEKDATKIVSYTAPTTDAEGSATVQVTFKTVNDKYTLGISGTESAFKYKTVELTYALDKLEKKDFNFLYFHHDLTTQFKGIAGDTADDFRICLDDYLEKQPYDGNAEVTYTSSDENVAVIKKDAQDGKYYAYPQGVGTVTITASASGQTATVKLNVVSQLPFSDVQDSSRYYFQPVYSALNEGYTAGTTDTTFGVGQNVTRAQMVTWLWKKAGSPVVATSNATKFSDVKEGKFYTQAVAWAVKNGITSGTTATTFSPNATVTRGQMVQFLYKYADGVNDQKYNGNATSANFTDVSATAFYHDAVQWAVRNGITAGKTGTTFAPNDPCTREQGVTFLYRV